MVDLKKYSLLMVGNKEDEKNFKFFFNDITLVKNNNEILESYKKQRPSIIFLDYGSEKDSEIIKKIRKIDKEIIIVLIVKNTNVSLLGILSLNLFGCLVKPFQKEKVERLLIDIEHQLKSSSSRIKKLKDNYFFNVESKRLFNSGEEVKLTKNEINFLDILLEYNNWVSSDIIEYNIWEEESLEKNCDGRLKALLNGIRKKLPKNSIKNQYGVGYKIES